MAPKVSGMKRKRVNLSIVQEMRLIEVLVRCSGNVVEETESAVFNKKDSK